MNKDLFAKNMMMQWDKIPLNTTSYRHKAPKFQIELININQQVSLIVINIPTAKEALEACYVGIAYDENYNVRYFTYEIAKTPDYSTQYALCEWTPDWRHINYGLYSDNSIIAFATNVENIYNILALSKMTPLYKKIN